MPTYTASHSFNIQTLRRNHELQEPQRTMAKTWCLSTKMRQELATPPRGSCKQDKKAHAWLHTDHYLAPKPRITAEKVAIRILQSNQGDMYLT